MRVGIESSNVVLQESETGETGIGGHIKPELVRPSVLRLPQQPAGGQFRATHDKCMQGPGAASPMATMMWRRGPLIYTGVAGGNQLNLLC